MHAMCRSPHPREHTAALAIDSSSLGVQMQESCSPWPRGPLQHALPITKRLHNKAVGND